MPLLQHPSKTPGPSSYLVDFGDYNNFNKDASDMGPAANPLAALMDCIPGFETAQLEELLPKLLIPDVDYHD